MPTVCSSRRQFGGATMKVIAVVLLLGIVFVAYRAWNFYQARVAPVVDGVAQVVAVAAGAAQVLEKLNPYEISRDPLAVADTLDRSFGIALPEGYKGAFDFNIVMLGQPQMRMVALIPEKADPATIFEGGTNEIRFNPGASTIFMAAQYMQAEPDEMRAAMARLAAGEDDGQPLEAVFIEAGGRKVAALRGTVRTYGATNTVVYTFLDDGRLFFATGPAAGFDDAALGRALAALVARHPANSLLNEHPKPDAVQPPANDPCGIPGLDNEFDVVAISVYQGSKPLDIALDTGGHEVRQEDVVVGSTPKPVVLLLMAYDPIVWNIGRAPDARIAGVLAQGVHRQAVIGLPKGTRITTYSGSDGGNSCRSFRAEGSVADMSVKRRVRELFGRGIGTLMTSKAGAQFVVGEVNGPASYSEDVKLKDIALPDNVLPGGQMGIDRLVKQQSLSPATAAQVDLWVEGAARAAGQTPQQYRARINWRLTGGVYYVQKPFNLPDGMGGANARTFILPAGAPLPGGPQGHNTFLRMDGFRCEGTGCP